MITSNISFTGITIDKTSIAQLQAQKLENAFSTLSDSLGEAINVEVSSDGDQLSFNISNENEKKVTTKHIDKNTCPDQMLKMLSTLLIKHLSATTSTLTAKVQQLQQKDEELQQSFKTIIHDLKSPLQGVIGFNELLKVNVDKLEKIQKYSKNIGISANRMNSMLEDLLQLMRIGTDRNPLNKQPMKPEFLFSKAIQPQMLCAQNKSIQLKISIEEDMPNLNVDSGYFCRVIDNLLSNAIKFSHKNTTVTLRAKKEDGNAIIEVEDQGQGIPEKELSKLFTPFALISSTPTAGESSNGLGLASVKKIVESHGGTITVISKVNEGTKFTIKLPLE